MLPAGLTQMDGRRLSLLALACLVSWLDAGPAGAVGADADGTMTAQYSMLRSPFGDQILRVRRYTETVGFRVYELLSGEEEPRGPTLGISARLRLDSDLGLSNAEVSPDAPYDFVPGLEQRQLDLLYLYVEGRGFLGGVMDFRAGRQQLVDVTGFWSFDGAWVQLSTPYHVALQVYGGSEERGGQPWSRSRYEADGVFRGDREGMPGALWPDYAPDSALAPAWGVALVSQGMQWLSAEVGYRQVLNANSVLNAPLLEARGERTYTERLRTSREQVSAGVNLVREEYGAARCPSARPVHEMPGVGRRASETRR